jgi:hypothetical protein
MVNTSKTKLQHVTISMAYTKNTCRKVTQNTFYKTVVLTIYLEAKTIEKHFRQQK